VISGASVGLAVTFVALYVYTAALRVTYPFDLEWEEGAFMDHVLRVVHGHPIYVRPSLDFTPFIYTPGYYYVGAAAVKVLGTSIVTLRAVSILSSLGVFCVLGMFAWRERHSRLSGVILAGLYAATYEIGGSPDWFPCRSDATTAEPDWSHIA
jgi:4-amino-4-deoxy-L-arabinose transferase-like glycosyltransferase